MAQLPCIGLSWPLTKPPFETCVQVREKHPGLLRSIKHACKSERNMRNILLRSIKHVCKSERNILLHSIKHVCKSERNILLRSIKHVCKCKERHHPHPTPPPQETSCCVASNMCASPRETSCCIASNMCASPRETSCCVASNMCASPRETSCCMFSTCTHVWCYHLESRWRNSHVLVYHGPLLSHLLGVAPSTFQVVASNMCASPRETSCCVASNMCASPRETSCCIASNMCVSARNVIIPTPPHPVFQLHGKAKTCIFHGAVPTTWAKTTTSGSGTYRYVPSEPMGRNRNPSF